ncbi:MAG: hypothetical protein ACTTKX_08890, partial [Treponema sp.]
SLQRITLPLVRLVFIMPPFVRTFYQGCKKVNAFKAAPIFIRRIISVFKKIVLQRYRHTL